MVLVDTSSWIESLRKDGDPVVRERVRALLLSGEAAWCDLVRLELWNGARGDAEKRALKSFERDLPCLDMSPEVWQLACDIARRSRESGITVPATDVLIAACASHHGAELEHRDEHFEQLKRIPKP